MSVVSLQQVKAELRITDNDSDVFLCTLLLAAEMEARAFCNLTAPDAVIPSTEDFAQAVLLLVRSKYDLEDARDMARYRTVAETLLAPHRILMGV